jgi:hypothetical protein
MSSEILSFAVGIEGILISALLVNTNISPLAFISIWATEFPISALELSKCFIVLNESFSNFNKYNPLFVPTAIVVVSTSLMQLTCVCLSFPFV